jgi:hypothetical protein
MRSRVLAIAVVAIVCAAACGEVARGPIDGAPPDLPPSPRTYKGTVTETSPVQFGGPPHCMYTITLRQVEVELQILPSGQVTGGQVRTLNVEAIVGTCEFLPADPSVTDFTFTSAAPIATGMALAFQEEAGDKPGTALTGELWPNGSSYQVQLTFHRNDLGPPLDWMIITLATLSLK